MSAWWLRLRGRSRWAPGLALALAGCDDGAAPPESAELATGEIGVSVALLGNGAEVQLLVTARTEGPNIELTGGDHFVGGPEGEPEEVLAVIDQTAAAQFATAKTAFRLAFVRGTGERYEAALSLPPAYAMATPPEPLSRAEPIAVTWDPGAGDLPMRVELDGACLSSPIYRELDPDPGAFTVQPADLFVASATNECAIEVRLRRARFEPFAVPGMGPAVASRFEQLRDVSLETVP